MSDDLDYLRLAARLRAVREQSSRRVDAQREIHASEGAIPLDDALRFLDTRNAATLVGDIQRQANDALAAARERRKADPNLDPYAVLDDRYLPPDPFLSAVVRCIEGRDPWTRRIDASDVPRAVISAFASLCSSDGMLPPERVERELGPMGKRILDAVASGLTSFRPGTERPKLKYDGLALDVSRKVAMSANRRSFIERMPALRELIEHMGNPRSLLGFEMASVQHLFPSTLALYDALEGAGLSRARTGVGGKSYSANADITARMEAEGWHVAYAAHPRVQGVGSNAERDVAEMAEGELRALFHGVDPSKEDKPRFLLLDEGGKLIRCLHEKFPEFARLCVAVEQTDRGIQLLEDMERYGIRLACPVINMARSLVKKVFEAPMIGESVVVSLEKELARLHPDLSIEPKVASIVGFGAVGAATARALLRRGYKVYVTDIDPRALERAAAAGCLAVSREDALSKGQVLISCTGKTTLLPEEYGKLPSGAVLVNAASGNHELGLADLSADFFARRDPLARRLPSGMLESRFKGREVCCGDAVGDEAMLNRVVRSGNGDHEVLVLRSGYVVNMREDLPPEYAQLIRGLLYIACIQASRSSRPGLLDLDSGLAEFLAARTEACLAGMGRSLEDPSFAGLDPWQL